jgi:hypothetical protein
MIIPGIVGTNRIEVGSPVPISNDSPEAELQDQRAAFGKAVFNLGNELDKVNKKTQGANDQYLVAAAVADAENKLLVKRRELEIAGIDPSDDTGTTGVDKLEQYETEVRAEALKKLPQRVHLRFEAESKQVRNEQIQKAVVSEVDKRTKMTGHLRAQSVQRIGQTIYNDPTKLVDGLLQLEVHLQEETTVGTLTTDQANIIRTNAEKELVMNGVTGLAERAEFEKASEFFNQNRAAFSVEEQQKEIKRIFDLRNDYVNFNNREEDQAYERVTRARREAEFSAQLEYTGALAEAGSSDAKRTPILSKISKDQRLSAEMKSRLMNFDEGYSLQNEFYKNRFYRSLTTGTSISKLQKNLESDWKAGKLTMTTYTELMKTVDTNKKMQKMNPLAMKRLDALLRQADALAAPTDAASRALYKAEFSEQASEARRLIIEHANRTMNPQTGAFDYEGARSAMTNYLKRSVSPIGNVQGADAGDMSDSMTVSDMRKNAIRRARDMIRSGKGTPAERKLLLEQLKGLGAQQKINNAEKDAQKNIKEGQ